MLLIASIKTIIGLVMLIGIADRFVLAAGSVAFHFRLPPMLVGVTIVAIGTSLPEIFVAIIAAAQHQHNIALGNAIGSNVTNIGMVLGLVLLIKPIDLANIQLKRDMLHFLVGSFGISAALIYLGLTYLLGFLLLAGFVYLIANYIHQAKQHKIDDGMMAEVEAAQSMSIQRAFSWIAVSLLVLPLSANLFVQGASSIASAFGISDLVIGITLVAFGTSLPELATTLIGTLRGESGIALGGIVGSNLFNLTGVIMPAAFIHPTGPIDYDVVTRDLPMMLIMTSILLIACFICKRSIHKKISRIWGALMVSAYLGYMGLLFV